MQQTSAGLSSLAKPVMDKAAKVAKASKVNAVKLKVKVSLKKKSEK